VNDGENPWVKDCENPQATLSLNNPKFNVEHAYEDLGIAYTGQTLVRNKLRPLGEERL